MNKKLLIGIITGLVLLVGGGTVYANPFFIMSRSSTSATATGTTTLKYMLPGTATTTLGAFDSYQSGNITAIDQLYLAIQFTASSSPHSVLRWRYEYSNDGVDWYTDSQDISTNATTTVTTRVFKEYEWRFASSTIAKGGTGTNTRALKIVKVPLPPTRYVRAKFYMRGSPTTHARGAVWAEFVPFKQRGE